jgi:negative regulator of replication initiation
MGVVMTTIEIDQRTAKLLQAKAAASGLSLDDYLRRLAESEAPLATAPDAAETDRILDELAQGGENLALLPVDFSREDIYANHD